MTWPCMYVRSNAASSTERNDRCEPCICWLNIPEGSWYRAGNAQPAGAVGVEVRMAIETGYPHALAGHLPVSSRIVHQAPAKETFGDLPTAPSPADLPFSSPVSLIVARR